MKIWCVDYSALSWHISSDLYLTKEEAQCRYDSLSDNCYRKMYQVEDIWGWCARNFCRVVEEIVASRDSGDGFYYVRDLDDELRAVAAHCKVEEFDVSVMCAESGNDKLLKPYFISVAWYHDGELGHMTFGFEGLDCEKEGEFYGA